MPVSGVPVKPVRNVPSKLSANPLLNLRYFSAQQTDSLQLPLVILHGWGSDNRSFDVLAKQLSEQRELILVDLPGFGDSACWEQIELQTVIESLCLQLPAKFDLMGWSLGGMIGVAFAHQNAERVAHLITLAANASFATQPGWKSAMPKRVYQQFCDLFEADPAACLKQFCGLQAQGDQQQRQVLKQLRSQLPDKTNANWSRLLALLGELDNRQALCELALPSLHLFGDGDGLVPVAAAEQIAELNGNLNIEVMQSKGHCLHLPESSELGNRIESFLGEGSPSSEQHQQDLLDKRRVAESFSRAAKSYDGAAQFQRDMADLLINRVPVELQPKQVLDVGCGTGYLSSLIRSQFANTHLTALDLAPGMIRFAQQKEADADKPVVNRWVCGDAEALPLADQQYDLVLSNLAYQWCEHPEQWGAELKRVLVPETGVAMLTSFAPDTLFELRTAWQAVDDYVHVNRFIEPVRIQSAMEQAGLECCIEIQPQVLRYQELRQLMRELKEIGAHNVNSGKNSAMTGRERLNKLVSAYEQFRDNDGLLTATYQVMFITLKNRK